MHCKKIIIFICVVASATIFFGCTAEELPRDFDIVLSNDDPLAGFWMGMQLDNMSISGNESLDVAVSFGCDARNLQKFEVDIDSEDFNVITTCPDTYVVDGEEYKDADFFCSFSNQDSVSIDQLPQKFKLTITKKDPQGDYSGCITVKITQYMIGGHSSIDLNLFYYGDEHRICFSTNSTLDAKASYESNVK